MNLIYKKLNHYLYWIILDKDEQSEETSYFLSKQKCLIQILDILYEFNEEIREKITNLKIDLQNLGDIVSRDKNTKAGGKFEWIDSILVKVRAISNGI